MAATATKTLKNKKRKSKKSASAARRKVRSKAQMIRLLAKKQGRHVEPCDIVEKLAANGIAVSYSEVRAALKATDARHRSRRRCSKSNVAAGALAIRKKAQEFFADELARLKTLADQLRSTDGFKRTVATLERRLERLLRFRKRRTR